MEDEVGRDSEYAARQNPHIQIIGLSAGLNLPKMKFVGEKYKVPNPSLNRALGSCAWRQVCMVSQWGLTNKMVHRQANMVLQPSEHVIDRARSLDKGGDGELQLGGQPVLAPRVCC